MESVPNVLLSKRPTKVVLRESTLWDRKGKFHPVKIYSLVTAFREEAA